MDDDTSDELFLLDIYQQLFSVPLNSSMNEEEEGELSESSNNEDGESDEEDDEEEGSQDYVDENEFYDYDDPDYVYDTDSVGYVDEVMNFEELVQDLSDDEQSSWSMYEEDIDHDDDDVDEGNDDNSGDEANDNDDDENSNESESRSTAEDANNPAQQQNQPGHVSEEEIVVHSQKKIKLDIPVERPVYCTMDDTSDDDQKCPICLDSWTNAGDHRLCALKCGHLFGLSCITEWLNRSQGNNGKNCPECKTKASKRDIRVLYARRLVCIDTVEKEKLEKELKEAIAKQKFVEQELDRHNAKEVLYKQELNNLKQKVQDLERKVKSLSAESSNFGVQYDNVTLKRSKIFDICNNGNCRVMAYNPWNKILVVSSGPSINRVFMTTASSSLNVNIHSGLIRDMAFQEHNPNYLLSVGFDKKVVLTDIRTNALTHSYQEETNLWSCCWANYNPQTFFVGGAKANVIEYDIRYLQKSVSNKENTEDRSPVVSLASVPTSSSAFRAGGYLVCQLNSCYAYSFKEGNYIGNRINIEGPFISLRYNEKDNHILLSCRASPKNPTVRHIVCTLEKNEDEIKFNDVHSFSAGNTQKLLSRPCYMNLPNDTMVIAHNENLKSIVAWSVSTGQKTYTLPISESVVDMCAFDYNQTFQAILTEKKLHLYQHKERNV